MELDWCRYDVGLILFRRTLSIKNELGVELDSCMIQYEFVSCVDSRFRILLGGTDLA